MKVVKIAGLFLMACLSVGIQGMQLPYDSEQKLLEGNISVDTYLLGVERLKMGHSPMVYQLRTADYSRSVDGSYYDQLIGVINEMVYAMRQDQITEQSLKSLKFKIRRYIEFYYEKLMDAKKQGVIREGRAE